MFLSHIDVSLSLSPLPLLLSLKSQWKHVLMCEDLTKIGITLRRNGNMAEKKDKQLIFFLYALLISDFTPFLNPHIVQEF